MSDREELDARVENALAVLEGQIKAVRMALEDKRTHPVRLVAPEAERAVHGAVKVLRLAACLDENVAVCSLVGGERKDGG